MFTREQEKKMKKFLHLMVAVLLIVLIASIFGSQSSYASAQRAPQVRWEAAIRLRADVIPLTSEEQSTFMDALSKSGVSGRVDGDWIVLQGEQNLAQLNATLFDTAASWLDFLGGPIELDISLPSNGGPLTLQLEARNTTGSIWELLPENGDYLQNGEAEFLPRYSALGAPAIQTIRLNATRTGITSLRLLYHRPFEPISDERHARITIVFNETVETIDLSDPTPAVLGEDEMLGDVDDPDAFAELDEITTALPSSWDWRTQGIVPDVRDQGDCGSCWAFGTVGIMESAVKKGGGPLPDLSEQFLVSCNKDGWSCDGGLTATKYHYNVLGINQTAVGAVLEADKPYTATNGTCPTAYNHPYKASGWAFVQSEWALPTVDEIKNAIYTYGPVAAAVCVDSGWYFYTGGVYIPGSNQCSGSVNHLIVLVGWDDATSSWILRNSWGPAWGEDGYMRIRWDTTGTTSRVGTGTSWVTYLNVPPTVPVLVSPGGVISDRTPTFKWSKVENAMQYRFEVYQGTTLKYRKTVSASVCGDVNCQSTPTNILNYATYQWRAQAYVGDAWQEFSAYKSFKISAIPVLVSPVGTITTKTPAFKWKKVDGATQYQFQVWQGTRLLYTKTVSSAACGTVYCTSTSTTPLAYGAYKWRAQAMVGGIWRGFSAYMNFSISSPKPNAGFWESNTGDEFYVTADQMNVDDFAIYISVPYCGYYKITHTPLVPIVNRQFSFSGSFYASGTFDTSTSSHGQDGLKSFYIPGCGYVTGGPWSWVASWIHASPPPTGILAGDDLEVIVEPILQGFDFITHVVKVVSP
jgi:inhibitor of cysteine peptidase